MMERHKRARSVVSIAATHTIVLLVAFVVGRQYWESKMGTLHEFHDEFAGRPQADAAFLAFRFGSVRDARILLGDLPRPSTNSRSAWGDQMITELRLAVLDGEQLGNSGFTPHLSAAANACGRFRLSTCNLDDMRKVAKKVALQRKN
jgi:hypothetical protein